ncbi:MAG: hypothetical protein VB045_02785 [Synergistaceae bacterium]|nr:hypothetical protein [Synergistaceae bacterium]
MKQMKKILLFAGTVFFGARAFAAELPPMDRDIPKDLKTATFALG